MEEKIIENHDKNENYTKLVERAKNGDQEAFAALYRLTYAEVYHTAMVLVHNENTVQDIVQETYYKCLKNINQLKDPERFSGWVKKIAVNTAKAHLRNVDWILFSEAEGEDGKSISELQDERLEHMPETVMEQAETDRLIQQILEKLDDKQRIVVGLFYYEEMSVAEIAEYLSCNVNTVKSRLNYARKKIEKEVCELEKNGTILHTLPPVSFLMYLFKNLRRVGEQIPEGKYLEDMYQEGEMLSSAGYAAEESAAALTDAAGKTGMGKIFLTGIAAAVICIGIGVGIMANQDRKQQVQEIQEMLPETDTQKQRETDRVWNERDGTRETDDLEPDENAPVKVMATQTPTSTPTPTPMVTPQPAVQPPSASASGSTQSPPSAGQPVPPSGTGGTEGNAGNTGESQESSSEQSQEHTHEWVQQTETIHHEASGHYETKITQNAYEEPIYEYHIFCNTCGADVTTDAQSHEAVHNEGFTSRKIQTGSVHHDAVTEEIWVEEPAYDEVVSRGYVCSICNAAK